MESAKLRALLYADIFDYPLTRAELEKWKIIDKSQISNLKSQILTEGNYFYLRGKESIVTLRKKREKISKNKLSRVQKVILLLKKIPTIKMIALTGALAMQNSKRGDDIDLLIVTGKGKLWLTRFLVTLLLDLKGLRRRPNDKNFANKICLNMFLDEEGLTLPKNEQDLYGAHEVCQIKPLFNKDATYERFLKANSWVKKFLPKAMANGKWLASRRSGQMANRNKKLYAMRYILYPLEWLSKFIQLIYMEPLRTTEVVTDRMLRFHPKDYRQIILGEYQKRLRKYE